MDRRDFMKGVLATPALASLSCAGQTALQDAALQGLPSSASASRRALRSLIDTLGELDASYVQAPGRIVGPFDEPDGYRNLMHMLEAGLLRYQEADPEWPVFHRLVSPTRKFMGDNPDAIYFGAILRGDRRYRIRGNVSGAVYTSFTIEYGPAPGEMSRGVSGVINDADFDVDSAGNYEILVGPDIQKGERNALRLPDNAVQISTRHYFERERSAAADPSLQIPLWIEPLDDPPPPAPPSDANVAEGIERVVRQLRTKTSMSPVPGTVPMPSWVGATPNQFPTPEPPGDIAYTALDASYTMAPYALAPDEALVMTGRFPRCRFSNVVLWNAFQMTYDYAHRPTSRNRAQTTLDADGRYRIILAHQDPGVPNWIDTEGRPTGMVFWRFFLPEEQPETPIAQVVPFSSVSQDA